jgi:predicted DNA-binding transcriptional regulator AlpA
MKQDHWMTVQAFCKAKGISRNTVYVWINKGVIRKKKVGGRTLVSYPAEIIDVPFEEVRSNDVTLQADKMGQMAQAIDRMADAAAKLTAYMEKQDERLEKLSGQVNRLQEQNEYKDELINALSDKINAGGGVTSDTPEEDQPELTYSEWLRSRQPS